LPGKGAAEYFLVPKGAVNQKRLKNTDIRYVLPPVSFVQKDWMVYG